MESINLDKFHKILSTAIEQGCSDVHLTAKQVIFLRCKNKLQALAAEPFSASELKGVLMKTLSEHQRQRFEREGTVDCGYSFAQRRFRINVYKTLAGTAMAIRLINETAVNIDEFAAAGVLKRLVAHRRGLLLVCGSTGAGKSTTLASMLDYLNRQSAKHIITLEDPIEFVFANDESLLHQREYGEDFQDFAAAVKMAMRQDPDVIMVGEIRDSQTMKATLHAAETGHLVLGTLHAASAAEVLLRIEGFFTAAEVDSLRMQLAGCLNSIIVQQLLPGLKQDLVCCMEILIATAAIRNIVRQGCFQQLNSQLQLQKKLGMQTMSEAVNDLRAKGLITNSCWLNYLNEDDMV